MTNRLVTLFIAAVAILPADQLTLTDGSRVTGSFLDGNARTIRFVSGDKITSFDTGRVKNIRLGDDYKESTAQPVGNVLPAGLAVTVKFEASVDSKRDAVGTDYKGSLVYGLPAARAPVVPAGSEVTLRLIKDDATGQINGHDVLTIAIVGVLVNGKHFDVSTVHMAKPPAPDGSKWITHSAFPLVVPVSAIGERVRVPAQTILMFTLAAPFTIQ